MDINIQDIINGTTIEPELLFPIPVFMYKFTEGIDSLEETFIKRQKRLNNGYNLDSENLNILEHSRLSRIKKFCEQSFATAFKQYACPRDDISIYITQSWASYTNKNQYQNMHHHYNSYLSGVFYIDTTEDDRIYFANPHSDRDCLHVPSKDWNRWNSKSWWLPAEKNSLIIFPSWLMHEVSVNVQDHERISISMNSYLRGALGGSQELNSLVLS